MPTLTRVIMSAAKKTFGNRKFYALPEDYALKSSKYRSSNLKKEETAKLVKYIDDNVIGKNSTFAAPYGRRKGMDSILLLHLANCLIVSLWLTLVGYR